MRKFDGSGPHGHGSKHCCDSEKQQHSRGKCCARKISVSLPEDIITFIDSLGDNRSKTIVTILQEYKNNQQTESLSRAYEEYSELNVREEASCSHDLEG